MDEGNYKNNVEKSMSDLSQAMESSQEVTTEVVKNVAPASGILDFIEENEIDLTVMGTHGHFAWPSSFWAVWLRGLFDTLPVPSSL